MRSNNSLSVDALMESIARRAMPEPNTGCLLWFGGVGTRPRMMFGQKRTPVARVICAVISDRDVRDQSWLACHTCDTPDCVNRDHLYVGTKKSNMVDAMQRGQWSAPRKRTHCKHGHEMSGDNIKIVHEKARNYDRRYCKACAQGHTREFMRRKAAEKRTAA